MSNAKDKILAEIMPSALRRWVATGVLGLLGLLLVMLAFLRPPEAVALQLMLIAFGVVALVQSVRLYRATAAGLVLTPAGIFETTGRPLAALDEIVKVERGVFAFKPSNGFVLQLADKKPGAWAPGLWWRMGRRVGVGGAISGAEGRAMADLVAAAIARRGV